MNKQLPLVAIVGRANVGKSTLFNLLSRQELATVADQPGITRDRNYKVLNNYKHPFALVDTGGLLGEENSELSDAVQEQTEIAIHEADLIIAMFDGKSGLHPLDQNLADLLRRSEKPVLWVVNKCETEDNELAANEFYSLGIDNINFISAAHNQGIKQLCSKIWELLDFDQQKLLRKQTRNNLIKITVLGKPNVGKSTLINRILGEQRVITSDLAGTTRDNIHIHLKRDDQEYLIVDTAGLRKKKNVKTETLEKLFSLKTIRAIAQSDIILLMIDATEGLNNDQDAKLASLVNQRGKGLIILINKWDAVEKDHKTVKEYEKKIKENLRFCSYAPILFISALTGKRCPSILQQAKLVYKSGQKRISTSELNKMVESAMGKNTPPIYRGQPVKFYFATQIDHNPPSFVLFFNHPKRVSESYQRYLKNYIRAQHEYIGYDIRLIIRKRRSKYATTEDNN